MISYLPLTFILPLIGFLILAIFRDRLSENVAALVGVGSMGLSALVAAVVGFEFLHIPVGEHAIAVHQVLWTWMQVGSFAPAFGLHLDGLALTMTGIITGVGFLIHLFASWYMRGEAGYARFFSYMNLFVASMLLLVQGDNLVLLYLGWEGVGICSYLLIGFYYSDLANGRAAIKAFTVTRVGDVFLAIAMFLLFRELGTLNIQEIIQRAPELIANSANVQLIALMLLGGAMGKSAQIPLHTWLADAMAGPTPVSALIHAATMVTAGVYLIARLHPVFLMAPNILEFVGQVGAVGVLVAGFSALAQTDIKRVLAYSTMSQIAYMFLALGVGAWQAAIFHLMTHAFFKALLFLSSGAVIIATHHEQNIFKMGGLWKKIPLVYTCFLVGGGALAALPFVTVGFYSKDTILWQAWASGHQGLFYAGLLGAFLTSVYTFRLIWTVFHGKPNGHAHAIKGPSYKIPLLVLLVLSTAIGALIHPPLAGVLPDFKALAQFEHDEHFIEYLSIATALGGVLVGFILFSGKRTLVNKFNQTTIGAGLGYWLYNACGFDALFDILFTKPFLFIARLVKSDPVDKFWSIVPAIVRGGNAVATKGQTGSLRGYAASTAFGAIILLFALLAIQVMGK